MGGTDGDPGPRVEHEVQTSTLLRDYVSKRYVPVDVLLRKWWEIYNKTIINLLKLNKLKGLPRNLKSTVRLRSSFHSLDPSLRRGCFATRPVRGEGRVVTSTTATTTPQRR